jgi:hypothetical protein
MRCKILVENFFIISLLEEDKEITEICLRNCQEKNTSEIQ